MRKNEPRLHPSDTYLKTVLFGWRGFLEGSRDDADQAQPQTLTMSATWPKPCIYAMFREGFPESSKTASPSW